MIKIALVPGAKVSLPAEGTLTVEFGGQRMNLIRLNGHGRMLATLQDHPVGWDQLAADGGQPQRGMLLAVHRLAQRRLVGLECAAGSRSLLTASAVYGSTVASFPHLGPDEQLQLSRFACLRRNGQSLLLESGRSCWRIVVHETELGALIAAMTSPVATADVGRLCPGLPSATVTECARFLAGVGAVTKMGSHEEPDEDRAPALAQREFHDVLMHAESRSGMALEPLGGQFPFAGKFEPLPAVKDKPSGAAAVTLQRPDLEKLCRDDAPLAAVMERRRSIREFAERPLTEAELGEFLYRVGSIRGFRQRDASDPYAYETTRRTYPAGGAAYDLEIYVTAWKCAGLRQGLYHYEPADHELSLVTERPAVVQRIMGDACRSASTWSIPQAVITLASRFNRLAWKYRGISYAITLKNAGVLYEAMYLAATAMGLAPCGLGGGDSAFFSEATGLDLLVESSVGEFMLGVPK